MIKPPSAGVLNLRMGDLFPCGRGKTNQDISNATGLRRVRECATSRLGWKKPQRQAVPTYTLSQTLPATAPSAERSHGSSCIRPDAIFQSNRGLCATNGAIGPTLDLSGLYDLQHFSGTRLEKRIAHVSSFNRVGSYRES